MIVRAPRRAAAAALVACSGLVGQVGAWDPPFDHEVNTANTNALAIPITRMWPPRFNAVHMALIPTGPYRGQVLVWDQAEVSLQPYQRWAIVDPAWTGQRGGVRFRNHFLTMPQTAQTGDLFCAGHAWMRDGRLLAAGGTATYGSSNTGYYGAALVYQFAPDLIDPATQDFGLWQREADLATTRWYPTVTMLADDSLLIAGGSDNGNYHNDYEVYRLGAGGPGQAPPTPLGYDQRSGGGAGARIYAGPQSATAFADYPRIQLLGNGQLFLSGWFRRGARWTHDPQGQPVYDLSSGDGPFSPSVSYASSILDPRPDAPRDQIVRIGGRSWTLSRYDVDYCAAGVPSTWQSYPPPYRLKHPRWMQNAVILPDATVFVFGGFSDGNNPGAPELRPELLTPAGWVDQPQHTGSRGYHATAVLLPDGRVFVGGADTRSRDYQIYNPPYLASGLPRPGGVSCDIAPVAGGMRYQGDPDTRVYSAWWDEALPADVGVREVVLMRPCSVTHHSDMDQRLVRLELVVDDDVSPEERVVHFRAPVDSSAAPRGWYMLFLVSGQGVPSEAVWVHLS